MSRQIHIVYYSGYGGEMANLGQALTSLQDDRINFFARTAKQLYDESRVDDFVKRAMAADVVFIVLFELLGLFWPGKPVLRLDATTARNLI